LFWISFNSKHRLICLFWIYFYSERWWICLLWIYFQFQTLTNFFILNLFPVPTWLLFRIRWSIRKMEYRYVSSHFSYISFKKFEQREHITRGDLIFSNIYFSIFYFLIYFILHIFISSYFYFLIFFIFSIFYCRFLLSTSSEWSCGVLLWNRNVQILLHWKGSGA